MKWRKKQERIKYEHTKKVRERERENAEDRKCNGNEIQWQICAKIANREMVVFWTFDDE